MPTAKLRTDPYVRLADQISLRSTDPPRQLCQANLGDAFRRADTTVVAADMGDPHGFGHLAQAVGAICRTMARIKGAGPRPARGPKIGPLGESAWPPAYPGKAEWLAE